MLRLCPPTRRKATEERLFQNDSAFRGECREPRAQAVIVAAAQSLHELSNFREIDAAYHHFYGSNVGGLHGKNPQAQTHQRHGLQWLSRDFAAQGKVTT